MVGWLLLLLTVSAQHLSIPFFLDFLDVLPLESVAAPYSPESSQASKIMSDDINSSDRTRLIQTLIVDPATGCILLGYHTSGTFAGNYTGLLGYANDGEEPGDAGRRIVMELSGLVVDELELRAVFTFLDDQNGDEDEYEFFCEGYSGQLRESESMRLEWIAVSAIPYEKMPADDEIWYPAFLEGKKLRGQFDLSPDMRELLSYDLIEVENF